MLEIKGRFSCGKIKDVGNSKILNLSNSDKDNNGNYINTYYQMFLNEKSANMFTVDMKKKIANPDEFLIVEIHGYLKVSKNGDYTNLTIIPIEVKEYIKNDGGNNYDDSLPF